MMYTIAKILPLVIYLASQPAKSKLRELQLWDVGPSSLGKIQSWMLVHWVTQYANIQCLGPCSTPKGLRHGVLNMNY